MLFEVGFDRVFEAVAVDVHQVELVAFGGEVAGEGAPDACIGGWLAVVEVWKKWSRWGLGTLAGAGDEEIGWPFDHGRWRCRYVLK